ncbi:Unknown protein, partial [Striga hermonthica]
FVSFSREMATNEEGKRPGQKLHARHFKRTNNASKLTHNANKNGHGYLSKRTKPILEGCTAIGQRGSILTESPTHARLHMKLWTLRPCNAHNPTALADKHGSLGQIARIQHTYAHMILQDISLHKLTHMHGNLDTRGQGRRTQAIVHVVVFILVLALDHLLHCVSAMGILLLRFLEFVPNSPCWSRHGVELHNILSPRQCAGHGELIREKYYPTYYRAEMERQFLSLQQGTRTVDEYEREFTRLAAFVPDLVRTEAQRAQRFIDGLYPAVRHNIVSHGTQTYARAVFIAQEVDASLRREAVRGQSSSVPP